MKINVITQCKDSIEELLKKYSLHPEMIVHNFVGIFWANFIDHIVKNIIKIGSKFYITRMNEEHWPK